MGKNNADPEILGLTLQQFDILSCISRIEVDGGVPSPKKIGERYHRDFQRIIQKPNLFTILKYLKTRGLIENKVKGSYSINHDGIKRCLEDSRASYLEKAREVTNLQEDVWKLFPVDHKTKKPEVTYLEKNQFSEKIHSQLSKAQKYYSTTSFPNLCFNPEVASAISRPDYVRVLWDRAVVDGVLGVTYLTDLNPEYLFNYVSRAYPERDDAVNQCLQAVSQLESHVKNHENIQVYYQDTPLYLDIHMPVKTQPTEFFSHLRGLRSELLGVIYVKSEDAAKATKELFTKQAERALLLTKKNVKKRLGITRKELEAIK